jgi:hypothetical protein
MHSTPPTDTLSLLVAGQQELLYAIEQHRLAVVLG